MPIAIGEELSANPSTLVVKPQSTRLKLRVKVFGGPLSASIIYTLPANRPVLFDSADCTEPQAIVAIPKAPSRTLMVTNFPLSSDRDVIVRVRFVLAGSVSAALTFDVDATVRASDASTFDTSCEISF
jgi:hypothetical protein